jgi:hypothetical protein
MPGPCRAVQLCGIERSVVARDALMLDERTAQIIIAGVAFIQNLRRGHYELGVDTHPAQRVTTAFTELARAI